MGESTHKDNAGKALCDGPEGCGGHERIGELFADMLSTSKVAIDSLKSRREVVLQPCQRKVQALEAGLRQAQSAVKALQSQRVNNTAEVAMLTEVIEKLKYVKGSAEKMSQNLQRQAQERDAVQRVVSTTRDDELE